MIRNTMSRGWTAAVAAALLATVFALSVIGTASADVDDVTVGSATVAPNGQVTISVTAGNASDIGAFRTDVQYDGTLVSVDSCTAPFGICSVDTIAADTVRINGSSAGGISGNPAILGTITFTAGSTLGVADLDVDPETYLLTDTVGDDIDVGATGGAITIAEPTPSPTPAPSATAGPTATPKTLPATGGLPGDDTSSTMVWLLAATGLVVLAGGAWATARARREI
ncbi:MAG: cohesin domain-containing protein [Dehalococcoidia bacterium]